MIYSAVLCEHNIQINLNIWVNYTTSLFRSCASHQPNTVTAYSHNLIYSKIQAWNICV